MSRISAVSKHRAGLAVGLAAGLAASIAASQSSAQTYYDQGYSASATRDDPDVGPVNDTSSGRFFTQNPAQALIFGSANVTRTDQLPDGTSLYFGSANSNAFGQAGDRFVKASAYASLDFTTGDAYANGLAIWSSQATPGADALVDVSVQLDRNMYFADFLDNAARQTQIADYANANIPNFQQADAFALEAGVQLTVRVTETGTGNYWYASIQEEVRRNFTFVKDSNGNPFIFGGNGDEAFTLLSNGTNISGTPVDSQSIIYNTLTYDSANYPPRYGISTSSIFGINNLFLHSNQTYDVSIELQCSARVMALSGLAEPSTYSAGCDAANSGYWLGLNNYRDFNGSRKAAITFNSTDTGFDLAKASPSAPGGGDTAVPEPATWAMMIMGFGVAGAALRRRRGQFAA